VISFITPAILNGKQNVRANNQGKIQEVTVRALKEIQKDTSNKAKVNRSQTGRE